uniref:PX domain-containing protein n=1 Tax=Araucaria cunninghamii TaxID=56994 RepID=A0A0D6QT31_ARACU
MMGSENDEAQEAHLFTSTDVMESLILNDQSLPQAFLSDTDYRSAMTSHDEAHSFPPEDPLQLDLKSSKDLGRRSFKDESLVEPPSYADVVFTPFGEESIMGNGSYTGESGNSFFSESTSSSLEYLTVIVSQPQKEQELANSLVPGGNTYVTYLIATHTNMPEYGGSEFTVRRRFRDVVTLADRLAESYRGFFIPPRPDKSVVESQVMQKQEFIEQRRIALEKYLCRLAAHPAIKKSDELRLFLQVQGKMPLPSTTDIASRMLDGAAKLPRQLFGESIAAITAQDVSQPAKGGRDLVRMFKELKQSVTNDWGGAKPLFVEEDKEFLEKKEKLQNLEHELMNSSEQAETLVKTQQELGETMGELGLVFIKLSKFETEEATFNSQRVRAADAKRLATAAVKASRFYREANAQSVKHLDKLHEYLGLMQAVHAAFSDRSNALLTVQTLLSDLSAMNARSEKLAIASSRIFGGDKTRIRRIEELKETIRVTEEARDCAMNEYGRIKENNKNELERFEQERRNGFFNMLKGFVYNQVGYAEKIASVWEKVAEETSGYAGRSEDSLSFGTPI